MGQYWIPVNLTKREYVNPHKLGAGLKLWEQLASHPGSGSALIVLCANMPIRRGGGDLDLDENWHGPERTFPKHNSTPATMPDDYQDCAKRTIGRWAGDRIAIVGDYAEDTDLPKVASRIPASKIYHLCFGESDEKGPTFTDVTDDVCRVIEHELQGRFVGDGWREWKEKP